MSDFVDMDGPREEVNLAEFTEGILGMNAAIKFGRVEVDMSSSLDMLRLGEKVGDEVVDVDLEESIGIVVRFEDRTRRPVETDKVDRGDAGVESNGEERRLIRMSRREMRERRVGRVELIRSVEMVKEGIERFVNIGEGEKEVVRERKSTTSDE